MKLYDTRDAARLLGVSYRSLSQALLNEKVPEPANKFGRRRAFTEEDVEVIRAYFDCWRDRRNNKESLAGTK